MSSLIRNRPDPERPRERCLAQGAVCLSLRELVAVILGNGPRGIGSLGLAEKLLARVWSVAEDDGEAQERALFHALESGEGALAELPGLGAAGRARLLAAFEVGRRYAAFRHGDPRGTPLRAPDRSRLPAIRPELLLESREWLGFVPVYATGTGGLCLVERGVRTHVNVDPAELFARVLALRPRAFYLFHNHPSGDLTPSEADIELTRRARDLASRLGVSLLGHCIVGPRGQRWIVV